MTPTERRALVVLLLFLTASLGFEWLRARPPEPMTVWLGPEHARELGVAGSASEPNLGEPEPVSGRARSPSGEGAEPAPGTRIPYDASGRLLVNQADSAALLSLRGVGPVMAGRLLEWRRRQGRLRGPHDLLTIRGIGPATLDRLLPQISFAAPDSSAFHRPEPAPAAPH